MPGPQGYGPGGKWIHDRAHRIMDDGKTPKSIAYAVATQQAHATGKSPKDFKTSKGVHEAKQKYDAPKSEYQKTAGDVQLAAFFDELERIEKEAGWVKNKLVLPLALAGSLGGGAKVVQHMGTSAALKAPTAITMKAPTVAKGLGGLTQTARDVREFMP